MVNVSPVIPFVFVVRPVTAADPVLSVFTFAVRVKDVPSLAPVTVMTPPVSEAESTGSALIAVAISAAGLAVAAVRLMTPPPML